MSLKEHENTTFNSIEWNCQIHPKIAKSEFKEQDWNLRFKKDLIILTKLSTTWLKWKLQLKKDNYTTYN